MKWENGTGSCRRNKRFIYFLIRKDENCLCKLGRWNKKMVQVHAEEIKDFFVFIYFLIRKDESCLLMPRFEPRAGEAASRAPNYITTRSDLPWNRERHRRGNQQNHDGWRRKVGFCCFARARACVCVCCFFTSTRRQTLNILWA